MAVILPKKRKCNLLLEYCCGAQHYYKKREQYFLQQSRNFPGNNVKTIISFQPRAGVFGRVMGEQILELNRNQVLNRVGYVS